MNWVVCLEILLGSVILVALGALWCDQQYSRKILLPKITEKPMFLALRVEPCPDGELIKFTSTDGKLLHGSYFHTTATKRLGILVFSHEYLANRWSFQVYADGVREAGFDVFAFDYRNHGDSEDDTSHPSLPWLTDREVMDLEAALDYLRSRPDYDQMGVALMGVSRGGSTSLAMASKRSDVWAVITDGAFPTVGTLMPYMIRFAELYVRLGFIVKRLPHFVYRFVAYRGLIYAQKKYGCEFLNLESMIGRISPRPWLAIHGLSDNYITPEVARRMFQIGREPKELWMVPKAKHNRSQQLFPEEYRKRITEFLVNASPSRKAELASEAIKLLENPVGPESLMMTPATGTVQ